MITTPDEKTAHEQQDQGYQTNGPSRPGKTNPRTQILQHNRKYHTPNTTPRHGQPGSSTTPSQEKMPNRSHRNDKDKRRTNTPHHTQHEKEMPIQPTEPQTHKHDHEQRGSNPHQGPGPLSVEDRADLQAAEEDEEVVDSEDPADLGVREGGELVGG